MERGKRKEQPSDAKATRLRQQLHVTVEVDKNEVSQLSSIRDPAIYELYLIHLFVTS